MEGSPRWHCLLVGLLLTMGTGFAQGQSDPQPSTSVSDNAIRLWHIQLETFVAIVDAHLHDIAGLRQQPDWPALAQQLAQPPTPHDGVAREREMRPHRLSPRYHVLALQSKALSRYRDDLLRRYRQFAGRVRARSVIPGTRSTEVAGSSSNTFQSLEQLETSFRERLSAYELDAVGLLRDRSRRVSPKRQEP